ncbi:hypothetical protein C8J56DRAFT_463478 [Mycena floridula]|nr:hypothetical protein C8J56DRAFT_463478 [Mycena floridula]
MTVSKFSGTLLHQAQHQDLQSHTVSAFSHFSFVHSQRSLVFADLQGTLAHVNGKDVMVLFDVMTNTTSGLGCWRFRRGGKEGRKEGRK